MSLIAQRGETLTEDESGGSVVFPRSHAPFRSGLAVLALLGLVALLSLVSRGPAAQAATFQAPSSIPTDCSQDTTQALLAWIGAAPDNSTLSFPSGACYRVEGTIEIRNRTGLDFEGNGATFRSFNAPDDQRGIWRAIDSSGLTFRNMTITGSYANGGTFNSSLQHAHGIDLRGSTADIAGVSISHMPGDCVYFGLGYDGATRSSGTVHDSSCSGTSRNGIAVSAGHDILVQRVSLDRIGFIGFDVEPNIASGNWGASNITFDSNTINAYGLDAYAVVENAPESNLSFTNNTVGGAGLRIEVVNPGLQSYRPQNITISQNTSTASTWSPAIDANNIDTLAVTGNMIPLTGGTMATVSNSCYVTVSGNSDPGASSPLTMIKGSASCTSTGPTISGFTPTSGSSSTSVVISGTNFTGATAVSFNSAPAAFVVNSGTQITATVPSGATSGALVVTTAQGTVTSSTSFSISQTAVAPPRISSFSPGSGAVGKRVTVLGTGFTAATKVGFSGASARFTIVSDTQITATVPSGAASGPISVTTPNGSVASAKSFRVT